MKASAIIIMSVLFFSSSEKYNHHTEDIDQLQKDEAGLIQSRISKIPFIVRVAWAMIQNGKAIAAFRQGMEVPEGNTTVKDQSQCPLASATKLFTGVMVVKTFEEGLIQLTAKASDYIDGMPRTWHDVSISRLLFHTDGIPVVSDNDDYNALEFDVKEFPNTNAYIDYPRRLPLMFESGAKTRYGQTGCVLLCMILEKIYKKIYEQIIVDKILSASWYAATHFERL